MISKNKQSPFITNQATEAQVTYNSKQQAQNQTVNPFQSSIHTHTSIQPQQTIQYQPPFSSSSHQATNPYLINQNGNIFANKGPEPIFRHSQDNSQSYQGNQDQNMTSFKNHQKNNTVSQQFNTNPPPNTFSHLNSK